MRYVRSSEQQGAESEILHTALLTGVACSVDAAGRAQAVPDLADLQTAWGELRDELLPDFVRTHPGQRPWAAWRFGDVPIPPHYGPWELCVSGRVRQRNRTALAPMIQRLWLQLQGELSDAELVAVNKGEPLTDDEAREMWAHLHQGGND